MLSNESTTNIMCFSGSAPSAEEEPAAAAEEEEAEAPAEAEADAPVGDPEVTEEDVTAVLEEPVHSGDAVEVHSVGFDLADAFPEDIEEKAQPEDPGENAVGGADRHSAGQGKARSAGAVSEPNESGSSTVVGVVCGIAVAAVGAITGYFTYQKKKLCFKVQRGDPESAKEENGTQSDPQVLSTLLNSS
ncbi:CD99 antigen-like [Cyprinus carpio]|uniref:CD99 antigen-like n=1 Tax=Cyprinus carpio TaxID=7962 RepID=A0A9Q9WQT8_CYPCA|nr:CD99 antigen-like [Cyprinus carpio]